ncbi:hypothetical protein EB02_02600 [Enterococcus faecium]|uniref:hypothetical protein n=1 Tax=Enterococcus faecium TaxID=1352 RepID=UPI000DF9E196|nr:hypothetical protein [Enterococcus faecium]RBT27818.1 hypothetical protein EB02_02600 [Enterococcus faecium]
MTNRNEGITIYLTIDNASVSQNKIENEQVSEKTLPVTNQNSNQSEIEDIQK